MFMHHLPALTGLARKPSILTSHVLNSPRPVRQHHAILVVSIIQASSTSCAIYQLTQVSATGALPACTSTIRARSRSAGRSSKATARTPQRRASFRTIPRRNGRLSACTSPTTDAAHVRTAPSRTSASGRERGSAATLLCLVTARRASIATSSMFASALTSRRRASA